MRPDLILLCFAYVLSQFFRAFLAVLTQPLAEDIGTTAQDLAFASGLWFLTFAAMQIPIGAALDRIGPRRTASVLLALGGGGGALVFAFATTPTHVNLAMALIGVGCSPVLMASYYIFATSYPPHRFATLAALIVAIGTIGNLIASYPTAWAAELFGWRMTLIVLGGVSTLTAFGLYLLIQDPSRDHGDEKGSVLDLLKMPALWLIFPVMFVNYAPAAGIRGLWIGPYFSDIYAMNTGQIGTASLVMGLAMIIGTFCYGPADRIFKTRKWVVIGGNLCGAAALLTLAITPTNSTILSLALMAAVGFFGASFPVIAAHARSFFPPHLTGRGVTLMNLFGIGGVGAGQFLSGRAHASLAPAAPEFAYQTIFAGFGIALLAGLLLYGFSRDRTD